MENERETTGHANIAAALAAAQLEMGRAIKSSNNPHFKSNYADLSDVTKACMPALNMNGIAVIQPTVRDEFGDAVKTVLIHGASGETLECVVPLIIGKKDMQGYGSAVTYARRYGLMAMTGIAPEDDDGNAAASNAPKAISADQFIKLRDLAQAADVDDAKLCSVYGAPSLEQFPLESFDRAIVKLQATIKAKEPRPSEVIQGDEIPY